MSQNEKIEIFGCQTELYESVKSAISTHLDESKLKIELKEHCTPHTIDPDSNLPMTTVIFKNRAIDFTGKANMQSTLSELYEMIQDSVRDGKDHDCRNCGGCRCPR